MKKFKNSRLSTDSRKLQTLALKIYFRGHKGHQGPIGQNLIGVFLFRKQKIIERLNFITFISEYKQD